MLGPTREDVPLCRRLSSKTVEEFKRCIVNIVAVLAVLSLPLLSPPPFLPHIAVAISAGVVVMLTILEVVVVVRAVLVVKALPVSIGVCAGIVVPLLVVTAVVVLFCVVAACCCRVVPGLPTPSSSAEPFAIAVASLPSSSSRRRAAAGVVM